MKRAASTSLFVLAIAVAFFCTFCGSLTASAWAQPSSSAPLPGLISEPFSLAEPLATAPIFGDTRLAPTAEALSAPLPPPIAIEPLEGTPPELNFDDPVKVVWYLPWTLVPLDGWANSAELGINGSSGNAESFSFQTGARFKRKTEAHLFDLRLTHNRTHSLGVEKQNNALVYADYDRNLKSSRASLYVKQGLEHDRFKAFDLRYNVNSGVAYRAIKSEQLNLKGRFGAGTSREFGGPQDRWVAEALFGVDYDHQWNKRNKFVARFDYFPEWQDFSNYRIVSDASWEMLWDQMGNLSLKIGAIDRYDSTPGGRQPNDLTYSMLLLYKF